MKWIAELRRRNVFRMAGLYLVGAWLVVQVSSTLLPVFEAPGWVMRALVITLAIGFVLALIFAWVFELTPEGLRRDEGGSGANPIAPTTARRLDRAIIAVLACALGYFAVDKFVLAPRHAHPGIEDAAGAPSIAVLPLANEGGAKDEQYFADGLSENLITTLSRLGGLKVISRNSAFQFRDSAETSRTIGEKLGVAHLLEGSVRRLGDTVRINATLVLASDGSTLWSERYDRPYIDLFKLQDEITDAVATSLRGRLVQPAASSRAQGDDRPPSGDLRAYDAYLRGRYFDERRTHEDFARAFEAYEDAVKRDPSYARAWASYASAKALDAAIFLGGKQAAADIAEARRFIDRALALEPDSPYVNSVNSRVLSNGELRFVDAAAAAQRAVALARNGETLGELALAHFTLGDAKGAEALQREALDYDRGNGAVWFWLSVNLASQARYDESAIALDRALERASNSAIGLAQRVILEVQRGNPTRAAAFADAMPAGVWRTIATAFAAQVSGDAVDADHAIERVVSENADGSAYQIAEIYALRRDPDNAFAWLDRAWSNRDPGIRRLLTDPFLAAYRDDPRFAAYRERVGLPAKRDR